MSIRLGDKVISGLGATLPAQAGHAGQFLTTNGSVASWDNVDSLPDQLGHAGQFLTTNGQAASWGTINIQNMQTTTNLVTSLSSSSTDTQYPSAKCVYDLIGNLESILNNINNGNIS